MNHSTNQLTSEPNSPPVSSDAISKIGDALKKELAKLPTDLESQISQLRTTEDLKGLRDNLQNMEISQDLQDLISETINESIQLINTLKKELQERGKEGEKFLGGSTEFIKNLEKSPLGDSLTTDTLAMGIGAMQSAAEVFKISFHLLKDFFLLPKDIFKMLQNKNN